ncbi:MAG: RlmE family RNA methyltransferase [Candidatus Nezhaarchaeota archaeon]|nr:RlmE family RNA methyltransferase [Candidatus Nezhaarchaeota archaeon]
MRRREERRDHYYRLAKRLGYRSRAAFKLKEAARSLNLLRTGDVVVDLGAAPGGWVQVAREFVGDRGFVLGVDISHIKPMPWSNVKLLRIDVEQPEAPQVVLSHLPRKADVVLSDLSPKLSGIWELDVARQASLVDAALRIIDAVLRRGGRALIKVFQGPGFEEVLSKIRDRFEAVKLVRPRATRTSSAEVYVAALNYKLS